MVFRLIRKKAKQELELNHCVSVKYGMYNMIPLLLQLRLKIT